MGSRERKRGKRGKRGKRVKSEKGEGRGGEGGGGGLPMCVRSVLVQFYSINSHQQCCDENMFIFWRVSVPPSFLPACHRQEYADLELRRPFILGPADLSHRDLTLHTVAVRGLPRGRQLDKVVELVSVLARILAETRQSSTHKSTQERTREHERVDNGRACERFYRLLREGMVHDRYL